MFDALQTRVLLGQTGAQLPIGAMTHVHVERAKATLRRMCALALTGSLDDAFFGFGAALGWESQRAAPHERAGAHKVKQCLWNVDSAALRAQIEKDAIPDIALVQYARSVAVSAGAPERKCIA